MLAPCRAPWGGQHVRLGRRLGLDTGLFVDREHQHVLRRIHVETADLFQALLELGPGEVAHDPVVSPVGLDLARERIACAWEADIPTVAPSCS